MAKRFRIEQEGFPEMPGMMLATIDALKSMGGSAQIQELDEEVADQESVSEEEQGFMMSGSNAGQPRLNYYLAWARTYLKRGGAIENSKRGVWAITERGKSIASVEDCVEIFEGVLAEERERAKARRKANKEEKTVQVEMSLPARADDEDGSSSANDWKSELLAVLRKMDPSAFERLAQRLLREAGFTKVEVRGQSGDGGIDGVGVLRVNLVSFQVFFSAKGTKAAWGRQPSGTFVAQ